MNITGIWNKHEHTLIHYDTLQALYKHAILRENATEIRKVIIIQSQFPKIIIDTTLQ